VNRPEMEEPSECGLETVRAIDAEGFASWISISTPGRLTRKLMPNLLGSIAFLNAN
jgi:hypothetical protein